MSAALIVAAVTDPLVKVGAYAGYASIVGLAVMSLLYFAQAREVKRLREWAGRAPERDAELAQRVQTDAQKRVVAQPLQPTTPAAQAAAAAALYAKVPPPPPPPAPLVGPPGQLARPVAPGAVPGTAGTMPAPSAAAAAAPGTVPGVTTTTPAPGSVPTTTSTPPPAIPAAMTAAAAGAAAARSASAIGNGAGQETHESDAARPDPLLPASSFADDGEDDGYSVGRTAAIVGGAVAVVLIAGVLMIALTRNDSAPKPNDFGQVTSPAAASSGGTATTSKAAAAPAVDRRATSVAVLNGTQQTGLARTVADEIEKARFTIGKIDTNADQTVPATTVSYRAGAQRAAAIIAQLIGVDRSSVQPVDANASVAADADVVVIVGADKIG